MREKSPLSCQIFFEINEIDFVYRRVNLPKSIKDYFLVELNFYSAEKKISGKSTTASPNMLCLPPCVRTVNA